MEEKTSPNGGDPLLPEQTHNNFQGDLDRLRSELVGGLLYTHNRANSNTNRLLEASSFMYALVEILAEKGVLTIPELDARKLEVEERLKKRFLNKGMGVVIQEPEQDKYNVQEKEVRIDCENRVHLCKAACCRLSFPLSVQDIREGVIQWDLRSPYLIAQDGEGYCKHLERATCRCTVRAQRPVPCRVYDCRGDTRIWLDFEKRVVNPDLETLFEQSRREERTGLAGETSPPADIARSAGSDGSKVE